MDISYIRRVRLTQHSGDLVTITLDLDPLDDLLYGQELVHDELD